MISLEQLADGSVSDRNFQKLMSLVLDTGGQSVGIRFGPGTDSVVFVAAANSGTTVVTHGLGRTPLVVLAMANDNNNAYFWTTARTATTFSIRGTIPSAASATVHFDWVAIG